MKHCYLIVIVHRLYKVESKQHACRTDVVFNEMIQCHAFVNCSINEIHMMIISLWVYIAISLCKREI